MDKLMRVVKACECGLRNPDCRLLCCPKKLVESNFQLGNILEFCSQCSFPKKALALVSLSMVLVPLHMAENGYALVTSKFETCISMYV